MVAADGRRSGRDAVPNAAPLRASAWWAARAAKTLGTHGTFAYHPDLAQAWLSFNGHIPDRSPGESSSRDRTPGCLCQCVFPVTSMLNALLTSSTIQWRHRRWSADHRPGWLQHSGSELHVTGWPTSWRTRRPWSPRRNAPCRQARARRGGPARRRRGRWSPAAPGS